MCLDWTSTELALLQKYHRSTLQLSRNLKDMVMVLQRLVIYSRLPDVTIQKTYIYMYIFQTNNIHQFIPIFSPLVLHPHWTNNKPWQTQQGRISERRFTTFAQLMKRHGLISQLHSLRRHNQGRQLKKMKSEVWNLRFDPDEHLWHMNIYEHLWTSMNIYEHLGTSRNI